MRRIFLFSSLSSLALLALPLVVACGNQVSDTLGSPDGGPNILPPPGEDGGPSDDGGGCTGPAPNLFCGYTCGGGDWYPATCQGNEWVCPAIGAPGPECPEDAGEPDACSNDPPISCSGYTYCTGVYQEATCWGGDWYCGWYGQCEDGGTFWDSGPWPPEDAGSWDAPPPPPPSFSCGDLACNPETSYCQINTGGPVLADGGVGSSYECLSLPSSCAAGAASCDCVQAFNGVSLGCGCIAEGNDVIITCAVP